MTALAEAPVDPAWSGMPGWGIAADLTPPELIQARQIKVLRKVIGLSLVLVVILCAAGYVLARTKHSTAESGLSVANDRTTQLIAQENGYASVTQIQSQTESIKSQISTLMTNEVDLAKVLATLRTDLPGTLALTTVNVTLNATPVPNAGGSLDVSGDAQVGTVTLGGNAGKLVDVAGYVTKLSSTPGIVNVIPTSNNSMQNGASAWQITLQLTDVLLTHRFAPAASAPVSPGVATPTAAATGGS